MPTDAPAWPGDRGGHVWPKDREVLAPDGARIRYTVLGPDDGEWLVLCAGFMCPDNFWEYLVPPLLDRYRVAVLNYRGVGASTDPRPPRWLGRGVRAEDYTIERFAGDVGAVMEAEDVTDATVLGHSMGVQVALETWRQQRDLAAADDRPSRVAALVCVTGPYRSPLRDFYGTDVGAYLFPFAYLGLPLLPRPVQKLIPDLMRLPIAMPVARLIRALGPHTPAEGMTLYFRHFTQVDPLVAMQIARGMHEFDASAWLHEVDVPTLALVGSADTWTPPEAGTTMLLRIDVAELVELVGGTHGALIEFPDDIHDVVSDFLHRHLGHARGPALGDGAVVERRSA